MSHRDSPGDLIRLGEDCQEMSHLHLVLVRFHTAFTQTKDEEKKRTFVVIVWRCPGGFVRLSKMQWESEPNRLDNITRLQHPL